MAIKRKQRTTRQKREIYTRGGGTCQLCGRPIAFKQMTLDHIIPLAMGGEDSMDNLQCSCKSCNMQKASFLPDKFFDRITEIFIYQMDKRYSGDDIWKSARNSLMQIL